MVDSAHIFLVAMVVMWQVDFLERLEGEYETAVTCVTASCDCCPQFISLT